MKSSLSTLVVICLLLSGAAVLLLAGDNEWTSTRPYGGACTWFSFHPQKNKLVFAGGWLNGFFRSPDGGTTWQRLDSPYGIFALRIHPRNPGRVIAVSNSVYTSTDEGRNWQEIANMPLGPGEFSDIEFHPMDPQTLYAVFSVDQKTGGITKSTDGGKTWTSKSSGIDFGCTEPLCGSAPQLEIDPTNGNVIYVMPPSRKVFKTTVGGPLSFASRDGGNQWELSTLSQLSDPEIHPGDLQVHPKNPDLLAATAGAVTVTVLDKQSTWSEFVVLPHRAMCGPRPVRRPEAHESPSWCPKDSPSTLSRCCSVRGWRSTSASQLPTSSRATRRPALERST